MGGTGPMFGQYNHFANYAVEKIPYAIERYTNEVKRLHRVLDKRLAEAEYLAGADYSMADIINFPWIRNPDRRNIDLADIPMLNGGMMSWPLDRRCSAALRCCPRSSAMAR